MITARSMKNVVILLVMIQLHSYGNLFIWDDEDLSQRHPLFIKLCKEDRPQSEVKWHTFVKT